MAYKFQPHLQNNRLSQEYSIAVLYHDIFDYPLKESELVRWQAGEYLKLRSARPKIINIGQYFVLNGHENSIDIRQQKELASKNKIKSLPKIKEILESQSDILMAGITGSLAMNAAGESSDIDLMIITKKGKLWTTRLKTLLKFRKNKIPTRKARDKDERNKACMNIWMDESDLIIDTQNAYIAHELAQIVPLINKNNTYEKLLSTNKWILGYWPNSVEIKIYESGKNNYGFINPIEKVAYWLQRLYMARKITREVVTPTRAFFHPMDWSNRVKEELDKNGIAQVQAPS